MPFIAAGDGCGAEHGEEHVCSKARVRQREPPGAQPCEADEAVSDEMAGLANGEVDMLPPVIANWTEKPLEDGSQPTAGVIAAKCFGGLTHNHDDAEGYGQPRQDPKAHAATLI